MEGLLDPLYQTALTWFNANGWSIEYNIKHETKKVDLTLKYGKQAIKSKTIPLDNNLVIDTQQSILNLYNHFNTKKETLNLK